nr:acyl-CoA carboxylase subunit beta [Heliorestis convoluta]
MAELMEKIYAGGAPKYHAANKERGKLFARHRLELLLDKDSFVEEGLCANCQADELPADGVICGIGTIEGRPVCIMANDSTVKAGSWGQRTVEKIIRIQERALDLNIPIFYLVDSAGARITDQVEMFPGRRGAGRIFYNQVKLSGRVPQICLLFGPSAAGGAYIPAFCDVVFMIEGNASMYLGSPRMAEMVIGEKVTLEEMGGARMHCTQSGCGDFLCASEEEAITKARHYLSYFPQSCFEKSEKITSSEKKENSKVASIGKKDIKSIVPTNQNVPFNMKELIYNLVDEGSYLEIKELFAPEIITAFARLDGQPVGIVANQPMHKGGVLFIDSADKATRFIQLCDAFNIPLLYLMDVPGFMIGTKVERAGMIRHGAKMISAMSEATVPKISVVVRKAYGAGLYAMCGPAFEPDACLALPTASIAVMGPEAAINAVYYNKIKELPPAERAAFINERRKEYQEDISLARLASELVVDAIVMPEKLRGELIQRFSLYRSKKTAFTTRKHAVTPV